jgi:hypothetical protein
VSVPAPARGFLVAFKPCGDVQHMVNAPEPGTWMTHWHPRRGMCQTSAQVVSVEECPGCPDCWRQAPLFGLEAASPSRRQRAARKGVWTVPATGGLL